MQVWQLQEPFCKDYLRELCFRIRRFILLVQTKIVISMDYGSSTRSWKPWRWMRLDLIFSMRDIYINSNLNLLTKFPTSNRSTKLKDILPWNISQVIMKTIPISTRIFISYAIKRASHCESDGKSMETETANMIRISQYRESLVGQILALEIRNPKEQDYENDSLESK